MRDGTCAGADLGEAVRRSHPATTVTKRQPLPPLVVGLGFVSLLTDAASEMIFPLLPVFVASLGGGAMALGWIEGLADLVASFLKLYAGKWADRCGKRRPFVVGGYLLSSLARPFIALALLPWHVLSVRVVDRVGKGLRGSPRDALIAAAVEPARRGEAFGFHRSMDHAGAVLGPLLAFAILQFVTDDLRTLFWLAAIPGVFAVVAVWCTAHDVPTPAPIAPASSSKDPARHLAGFLLPLCVFSLGRVSDVFLLALAAGQRDALVELPLLWIGLSFVRSSTATLGGRLADRFGASRMVAAGWLVHAAVFAALAFTSDQNVIRALFLVYGLHAGLSEGAEKALVAAIAPQKTWGAAFGWYHFAAGVIALVANVGFGTLWDLAGQTTAFLASAGAAMLAVVILFLWARAPRRGG